MTFQNEDQDLQELRARIAQGHKGDDIPIMMEKYGCDYDAACDAIFSENTEKALSMLDAAVTASANKKRANKPSDTAQNADDCRYVVEVYCSGMGFVKSKYGADTPLGAKVTEQMLLKDDSAWVNPKAPKQTRIWDRQTNDVLA